MANKSGKKRLSQAERSLALEKTARLTLQGKTAAEIGVILGVSRQQVDYDRKIIDAAYKEKYMIPRAKQKDIAGAKLDEVERQAWESWLKSLEPEVTETIEPPNAPKITTRYSSGNPQFLGVILKVHEQRVKLFGLDEPIKFDLEVEIRKFARANGMDEDEAVAAAVQIVAEVQK